MKILPIIRKYCIALLLAFFSLLQIYCSNPVADFSLPLILQLAESDPNSFAHILSIPDEIEMAKSEVLAETTKHNTGEIENIKTESGSLSCVKIFDADSSLVSNFDATVYRMLTEYFSFYLISAVGSWTKFGIHTFLSWIHDFLNPFFSDIDVSSESKKEAISYYAQQYGLQFDELAYYLVKFGQLSKYHYNLLRTPRNHKIFLKFLKLYSYGSKKLKCPNFHGKKAPFMASIMKRFESLNEVQYGFCKLTNSRIINQNVHAVLDLTNYKCFIDFISLVSADKPDKLSNVCFWWIDLVESNLMKTKFQIAGATMDIITLDLNQGFNQENLQEMLLSIFPDDIIWKAKIFLKFSISKIAHTDAFCRVFLSNSIVANHLSMISIQVVGEPEIDKNTYDDIKMLLNALHLNFLRKEHFSKIILLRANTRYVIKSYSEAETGSDTIKSAEKNCLSITTGHADFRHINPIGLFDNFTGYQMLQLRFAAPDEVAASLTEYLMKLDIFPTISFLFKSPFGNMLHYFSTYCPPKYGDRTSPTQISMGKW